MKRKNASLSIVDERKFPDSIHIGAEKVTRPERQLRSLVNNAERGILICDYISYECKLLSIGEVMLEIALPEVPGVRTFLNAPVKLTSWNKGGPGSVICFGEITAEERVNFLSGAFRKLRLQRERELPRVFSGRSDRNYRRFPTNESIPIVAQCEPSFAFGELLFLKVKDIAANGLGLTTSLRNQMLMPGQELNIQLFIPLVGLRAVVCIVENIRRSPGDDFLEVGVKFRTRSPDVLKDLGRYLVGTSSDLSLLEIRRHGFPVKHLEKTFRIRLIDSEKEFHQVCDLRLSTAQHEGRFIEITDSNQMSDQFDSKSHILGCYVAGKIIATVRLVENMGNLEAAEHTSYGVVLPSWLLEGGFLEVGRLCTTPEFRGGDVFARMLIFIAKYTVDSGNKYMVLNCSNDLLPIYKRFGAKELGIRFNSSFYNGRSQSIVFVDVKKSLLGIGVHPIMWSKLIRPLVEHLSHSPVSNFTQSEETLVKILKFADTISTKFFNPVLNLRKSKETT